MPGLFTGDPLGRRTARWVLGWALVIGLISATGSLSHAAPTLAWPLSEGVVLLAPGSVRLLGSHVDSMEIRAAGAELGDHLAADRFAQLRLRLTPRLMVRDLAWGPFQALGVVLDVDLTSSLSSDALAKPLAHDPVWQDRTLDPGIRLMQGHLGLSGPSLSVLAGLTRSQWGTGMLANDGVRASPGAGQSPFGVMHTGDRVARLQLAWKTGSGGNETSVASARSLTFSLAADAVVDDDTASWLEGDRAFHAVGAVLGRYGRLHGGLYLLHRIQRHAAGGDTRAEVLDAHVQHTLIRGPIQAWIEGELATIVGETTFVSSAAEPGPFRILSSGGLLRVGLRVGDLSAVVESGAASGDNNPYDDQLREFAFDRSFKVGLLMFGEGLRQITAVSAYNVADPGLKGSPPRGFDRIPTAGAVRGATYVNPRLSWAVMDNLSVSLGYVHAESEEDYTDPFQSGLAGGESRGPLGAPGQRNLGDEVDVGLSFTTGGPGPRLQARLEAGWWWPGSVFRDPEGSPPDDVLGVAATVEASW